MGTLGLTESSDWMAFETRVALSALLSQVVSHAVSLTAKGRDNSVPVGWHC